MLRTAFLSLLVLLCGYSAAAWLTHDFQVWTEEGARRLEVALHPVAPPAAPVQGPHVSAADLTHLLAQPGRVTVVDFIYTHCQTVCLSLGSSFQQMQGDLKSGTAMAGNDHVRLVSISFDGARDDPATLARYAERQNADPSLWRFVRVPQPAEEQALLRRLGVVVIPDGRGDYEHNAALLVFNEQGHMVRVFDLAERELALNYARHLAKLQSQKAPA